MSGMPPPFSRAYAWDALMSGNPTPLYMRQPLPSMPGPQVRTLPSNGWGTLPPAPAYPYPPPPGPPPMAGAQIGAPNAPPAIAPATVAPPQQPFAADYAAQAAAANTSSQPFAAEYAAQQAQIESQTGGGEGGGGGGGAGGGTNWGMIGAASAIAGAVVSIVGAVGSAYIAKQQLKAQARTLEHKAMMANINARQAERSAHLAMEQGRQAIASQTAQAGQVMAKQRTQAAARGVVVDQGSAGDITRTTEIVKEVERLSINKAAVARSSAARMQQINFQNESLLSRVGAGNLRRTAAFVNPAVAGAAAFVGSSGNIVRSMA